MPYNPTVIFMCQGVGILAFLLIFFVIIPIYKVATKPTNIANTFHIIGFTFIFFAIPLFTGSIAKLNDANIIAGSFVGLAISLMILGICACCQGDEYSKLNKKED